MRQYNNTPRIRIFDYMGNHIKSEYYDTDGKLIKSFNYGADGSLGEFYKYEYDDNDNLIAIKGYNADGSPTLILTP